MNAADSSLLIAAFASWHDHHEVASRALSACRTVSHSAVEAYSVLTRLPEPFRMEPAVVADWLDGVCRDEPLALDGRQTLEVLRHLVGTGVSAGATYDGLIALTAHAHAATLLSLDRRAETTYRALGVKYRMLG